MSGRRRAGSAVVLGLLLAASFGQAVGAGRRPYQRFDVGEGLAGDRIWDLVLDPAGALWIATATGLSRFDGVTFRSYDERHGLPHGVVARLFVASDGRLWAGTNLGAATLDPESSAGERPWTEVPLPVERPKRRISTFAETSDGRLFAGGPGGLFALTSELSGARSARFEPVAPPEGAGRLLALAPDRDGALWVLHERTLYWRAASGSWRGPIALPTPLLAGLGPTDLALADDDRLWVAGQRALCALAVERAGAPESVEVGAEVPLVRIEELDAARRPACVDVDGGLPRATSIRNVRGSTGGRLLASSSAGIVEVGASRLVLRLAAESASSTLPGVELSSALESDDGTLWVGTRTDGLVRFPASGLETFGATEGLSGAISALLPSEDGVDVVTDFFETSRRLLAFDSERFVDRTPAGAAALDPSWAWGETSQLAADGAWWVTDRKGLLRAARGAGGRFAALERIALPPAARFEGEPFRLWREPSGAFWVASSEPPGLARFEPVSAAWESFPEIPAFERGEVTAWALAPNGTIWIGCYNGRLARRRPDERFELVETEGRTIEGFVYALLVDPEGRLWAGSGGSGLHRLDRPDEPKPLAVAAKAGSALDHLQVYSIARDASGRILIATAAGLHRLDPGSGELDVLTSADGLPGNWVNQVVRSDDDTLWVATQRGLARFVPPGTPRRPKPVRIVALSIAGRPEQLPIGGLPRFADRALAPSERTVEIEVASIHLGAGAPPRFEWRLGDGDWSAPSSERTLRLAGLVPGPLRLEARAVSADGLRSATAASVELVVRPPFWRTSGFLAALGALLAVALLAAHRLRVARLLALERVRTRIAADLHDDLGSSLSRISILSEVASRQSGTPGGAAATLAEIGATARELAEMTGDIVWAVDPQKDDLASLASRLRRFGAELVEPVGARFVLEAPDDAAQIALPAAQRRDLYLLIKEALHNAAKYSGATHVKVMFEPRGGRLALTIADDGRGFGASDAGEAEARGGGRGSKTMRVRAERLGGALTVASTPGAGTTITLSIPL